MILARLLDPAALALGATFGALALLTRKWKPVTRAARRGRAVAWITWGALYVLACPLTENLLNHALETRGTDPASLPLRATGEPEEVLVVLAAGFRTDLEGLPASERLDGATQARLLTAARVALDRKVSLVVASGGPTAMAEGMRELLLELGVPEALLRVDAGATSTRSSAARTKALLDEGPRRRVFLVTSALHLARAAHDFAEAGVPVTPMAADVRATPYGPRRVNELWPSSASFATLDDIAHEGFGWLGDTLGVGP